MLWAVLFEQRLRDGIADGSVTVAFRRWKRAQVVAGRRYRTGTDLVEMDEVTVIRDEDVSAADARAAGFASVRAALESLPSDQPDAVTYRLRFHRVAEPDPRAILAATSRLDASGVKAIAARLARMDKAAHGPWTAATLAAIAADPGRRAPDLAAAAGRPTQDFKRDVRKLKELGLTYSLKVGYQLSPRGAAFLAASERG